MAVGLPSLISRLDAAVGDGVESAVRRKHARRLDRLGWSRALDPPDVQPWAAGDPPPRPANQLDVLIDGEQAFAAIQEDRPQIILLDLDLPGMDGLALVRKLKADPGTRDIHVVAVTCYPEHYPKAAALAAGCNAYLLKPINTRELSGQLTAVAEGDDAVNQQAKGRPHEPPHR